MNLLFVVCLLVSAEGTTESKDRAGDLLDQGNTAFTEGRLEQALEFYTKAHVVYPSPKIQFNIAQAQAALDRSIDSVRSYDKALAGLEAHSPLAQAAQAARAGLMKSLIHLTVSSTPTAKLIIDGQAIDAFEPIYLVQAPHNIRLEADGYAPWQQRYRWSPGAQHVTARLQPLIPQPASDSGAQVSDSPGNRWWIWAGAGAAVVGAVIVTTVVVSSGSDPTELGATSLSDWRRQ